MTHALPVAEELVPAPDPFETCTRFAGEPFLLFLDSAEPGGPRGRYTFLAADPPIVIRAQGPRTEAWDASTGAWSAVPGDALNAVADVLAPFAAPALPELPPFQGGAAGYLSYDWGAAREDVPPARHTDAGLTDATVGIYDWVLAWDHATGRAWIVSTGLPALGPERIQRAARRLRLVRDRVVRGPVSPVTRHPPAARRRDGSAPSYPTDEATEVALRSTFTRAGYINAVSRVIAYIRAGDVFQTNLSQRFHAPLAGSPLDLYARLRRRNPAPFSAFLDFGGIAVASASPERFLCVRDRHVETRPIKGTRPRGAEPQADAALAAALAASEKERAENVMIVDVVRNDLSRVCAPGTVRAPELCVVERFATVQHLVSTVVGELAPGRTVADLVRAAFPGGSVTGAPKIRAMQIIAELEPTDRGLYCGTVAYWSLTGAFDSSIAIRTCIVRGQDVYFHAGGGVVADSSPEEEWQETLDKARGLIAALAP